MRPLPTPPSTPLPAHSAISRIVLPPKPVSPELCHALHTGEIHTVPAKGEQNNAPTQTHIETTDSV